MLDDAALDQARDLLATLEAKGLTLATAESCTGGLIAAALTAIAGSSAVVMAGFVTYSNAAKMRMVGVQEASLAAQGAVSETWRARWPRARWRARRWISLCPAPASPGLGGDAGQAGRAGVHRLRAARRAEQRRTPCLSR